MSTLAYAIGILPVIALYFLPTIIAVRKNHPHKVAIILMNILGGLLYGIGWFVSLIWVFVQPNTSTQLSRAAPNLSVADELHKLNALKEQGVITSAEFEKQKKSLLS